MKNNRPKNIIGNRFMNNTHNQNIEKAKKVIMFFM